MEDNPRQSGDQAIGPAQPAREDTRLERFSRSPWFPWLLRGLLLVAVTVAYLPSFRGQFVFDDQIHIVQSQTIQSLSTLIPEIFWQFRPVIFLSLWFNYQLGKLNVLGYHLLNFAVHMVAGMTLFGLVRRTLRLPPTDRRLERSADLVAFIAALLWLIHPLQTQAVTYVIQRCESMMGMFFLLYLYCLLRASQSARPWPWYVVGIAVGWLGIGCKEVMAMAPVVAILYDRVFLSPSWTAVARRRWGFYVAMLPAVSWLGFVIVRSANAMAHVEALNPGPTPLEYLCSQPAILLHYLRLAVLPDRLCFDYVWRIVADWKDVVLPGLAVLGLFVASLVMLCYRPRVGFLAFSFFVILAPTSSFNPIDDLAVEHRMYLPLALLMVLGVLGASALMRRILPLRRRRAVIYGAMVIFLAATWTTRTFVRNLVYTKPDALWANALALAPDNPRAWNNLGCYFASAGEFEQAMSRYRRAIELDPQFPHPYCNLARNLDRVGKTAEGIAVLRQAVETARPSSLVHCDLGNLLAKQGKTEEALAEYRRALEINPQSGRSHYKLAIVLVEQGKLDEAIEHLHTALKQRPKEVGGNFWLGLAYQRRGEFAQAIDYYQRTLELSPKLEKAQHNLELCLAGKKEGEPPRDKRKRDDSPQ